jgi:ssRNA-specific RNase YbeY (16S rRNA maturation enzyme)
MLHLSGQNDKTEEEQENMRAKEAELISLFHVEHEK